MRQRAGAAVENALHVIQYRQNDLIFLADLAEVEPPVKFPVSISYSEGVLCPWGISRP
jgi:hypothetical protein